MEDNEILNVDDEVHLFSLQYVYRPRIQKSLDEFREGWNRHPLSTEHCKTPYQIWTLGMMDKVNKIRAVLKV